MKLPPKPTEVDSPGELRQEMIRFRDAALMPPDPDFAAAVVLSHVIAWLGWAQKIIETKQ